MISRVDGAPTLPIKDEVDLAIDARAAEILREYDVTPEEAAQMARADVMQNLDMGGAPTPAAALAKQHQAAGASPERAQRLGEGYTRIHGPQEAWGRVQRNNTPEGKAFLENAQREMDADDARHQKMYDDHFTATGAPSHQRVTPETQRQWDSSERNAREAGRIIRSGLHPQTPVDPGTPEQNARWDKFLEANPDEMARYRPEEAAARQQAAQKAADDKAWTEKRPLLVQRYGEEEVRKVEEARAQGQLYLPRTPDQIKRGRDYDETVTAAMDGNTVAREKLRAADRERFEKYGRPRMLREIGRTPEDAKDMSDDRIRILLREKRAKEKQAKDLLWRPRTMIQAGNAIGAMALPGMDDWQLSAIRGGPTPLDVEARQADMASKMAQTAITGFLANTPQGITPAQQQAVDYKRRQEAATYADAQWAQKPSRARTVQARERLARDIENRFGPGMGAVAAELDVIDLPDQRAEAERSPNATGVGPSVNPLNPGVPLAAPSRPPGV